MNVNMNLDNETAGAIIGVFGVLVFIAALILDVALWTRMVLADSVPRVPRSLIRIVVIMVMSASLIIGLGIHVSNPMNDPVTLIVIGVAAGLSGMFASDIRFRANIWHRQKRSRNAPATKADSE